MNKFQKVGLAVAFASGMAVSAGNLWGPDANDFPSLQVRVPDVEECWAENQTANETNPCYNQAGWWYGYEYEGGSVEVRKENSWVAFKTGTTLTAAADGASLIDSDRLWVKITGKSKDGTAWGGAGIGFDYGAPKEAHANIEACLGYKIKYRSDGLVNFKLGHDEKVYSDQCTREFDLPPKSTPTEVSLTWDQFQFPSWCTSNGPANIVPFDKPLKEAESVKIAAPATQSTTPNTVNFELYEFGFIGSLGCAIGGHGGGNPILTRNVAATGLNFSISGRTVSMSVKKDATVQVINLQGAVVHTQTLTPSNGSMNLSKLPTGVYMIRVPALEYVNKIMLK